MIKTHRKNKTIKKQLKQHPSWPEIENIMKNLIKKGFQVVVAGGAVRDALLKRSSKDIDLASSAKPEEILNLFPSAKGTFAKYAVVFIPLKTKGHVEITSFRKEASYQDGRRPEFIFYGSMEEDVKRRDFTINALFYDIQKEELIDLVGGLLDLKQKKIRTVGEANKRFKEDHLRILRALRFSHQLGFSIEEKTKKAIPILSHQLKKISKERILEELLKMVSVGHWGEALKILKEQGIFEVLFPHLICSKSNRNKPFNYWNKDFSFYKDQAYFWTVLSLPFYSNNQDVKEFLKNNLISSSVIKKSLDYFGAVQTLTNNASSFTKRLQALSGQKNQAYELALLWLKSENLPVLSLKKTLEEFEKREEKGKLPAPLVTGIDILKSKISIPKKRYSELLDLAFEYQMENPKISKKEIFKQVFKNPNISTR